MPTRQPPLVLTGKAHEELRQMSVSRTLPPGELLRARVILMLAEGRKYGDIQKLLRTSAPTISRWKKRFIERGIQGLPDRRPAPPKRTAVTPELREKVGAAMWRGPGHGVARWSCRTVAPELASGKDLVHPICGRVG